MKKTMFITSVIMVVVMAIALTTSSLAWFSTAATAVVKTNPLTIQAKAVVSSGIQISDDGSSWHNSITMVEGNSVTNMMPLAAYTHDSAEEGSEFLYAMINNSFIRNEIDQNLNFVGTPTTAAATEYFTKDLWITNVSQGSAGNVSAGALAITPSITFYSAYTDSTTNTVYSYNSLDPKLYVVVLADNGITVGSGDPDYGSADAIDYHVISIFCSDTSATTINFGKVDDYFDPTADPDENGVCAISQSYTTPTIASLDDVTTTALQPIWQNNAIGEVKKFKVIAWYDGYSLKNSNSGFDVMFELTFTAAAAS